MSNIITTLHQSSLTWPYKSAVDDTDKCKTESTTCHQLLLWPTVLYCHQSSTPTPTVCQQVSLHHCTAGLPTAAALQQKAVKAFTNKARHAVATELTSWLQQLNMPDRSMHTVMPEDILVFLVQQRLPNHAGSASSPAELSAAPNS